LYPKTTYYLSDNSLEKSHWDSVPPEYESEYKKSIERSPTAFQRPFSIFFWEDDRHTWLSFLLDERHKKFYLYYIDFEYNDKNIQYKIDKEYIIDYNGENVDIFFVNDIEWIKGFTYSFLPYLNIKPFSRWAGKNKEINVRAMIAYSFDGGEIEYQYIDYLASKWTQMDWFSPLWFILMMFIPWW
jgi:hypothetical protein